MIKLREATIQDLPLLLEFEKGLIEYEREFTPNLKKSSFNYYDLQAYIENPEIANELDRLKEIVEYSTYFKLIESNI